MDMRSWIKQGCLELGLEPNQGNIGVVSKFLDAFAQAVISDMGKMLAETAPVESPEWRKAIQNELVVLHLLDAPNEENPRKALADIIEWNMKIALDPAVSKEARDLIESGANKPRPITLVKLRGRVAGSYERAHEDIYINPSKVTSVKGGRRESFVRADGLWYEIGCGCNEVAKRLGLVKSED